MKNKASLQNKIYRKLHWFLFGINKPGRGIRRFYPAYCRGMKYVKAHGVSINELAEPDKKVTKVYFTQVPNEGAGIGHQMSNHNAGYHYSQLFGIPFAYSPFSLSDWDAFLGFGEGEVTVEELKKQGYKMLRLPYFSEKKDFNVIRNIINACDGKKIILQTELDQFYKAQYPVSQHLKEKFRNSPSRKNDKLIYSMDEINVAMHIRRGDICVGQVNGDEALTKRWLDLSYFHKVLAYVKQLPNMDKPLHIYIFSQGNDDYSEFEQYGKVTECLNMSDKDSFLHMVNADVLVTSKSSFSYKAALLSDGIKICPAGFWHDYPDDDKWIVMDI